MADQSSASPITTIMFTDLVGSTELLDRLGDDAANEAHHEHFTILRRAIVAFGGWEVKSLGDGLMVSFPSAVAALRCAIAIQNGVSGSSLAGQLRIGLDAGEPIRLDDDLFGTTVVIAKRLCDTAQGGQIVASDLVCRLAGRRVSARFTPVGMVAVKGLSKPVEAMLIDWHNPSPSDAARPHLASADSTEERPAVRESAATPGLASAARLSPDASPARRPGRVRLGVALGAALAAAGALVALGAGGGTHQTTRSDGSAEVFRASSSTGSAEHPCYLRPGGKVLFSLFTNGYNNPGAKGSAALYVAAPGSRAPRAAVARTGNSNVNLPGSCYSPVAARVAFSSDLVSTDNIWTAQPSGLNTAERKLTCYSSPKLHAEEPSWSPDARFVVYALVNDATPTRSTIWTLPASNNCAHPVAPTRIVPGPPGCGSVPPGANREPNWAPDRAAIVLQSQPAPPDGPTNLWIVRPDGCTLARVTNDSSTNTDPSWSPNARQIVYSTDFQSPTGIPNLFIAEASGAARTRLTSQCYYDGAPSWSPDGKSVSFETWPVSNPSGNDRPTAIWRIPATARPRAPVC